MKDRAYAVQFKNGWRVYYPDNIEDSDLVTEEEAYRRVEEYNRSLSNPEYYNR